jgi:UDP-glucose 4-epimerase
MEFKTLLSEACFLKKLRDKVQDFFKRHHDISGVIHFAASKAVGESVENVVL